MLQKSKYNKKCRLEQKNTLNDTCYDIMITLCAGVSANGLVLGGDASLFDNNNTSFGQVLLQDAQKRQALPSSGVEGRRRPSQCRLHHPVEASIHCQCAKSQEPHWDLPMFGGRRGVLDFFDGSPHANGKEAGIAASKFLLHSL